MIRPTLPRSAEFRHPDDPEGVLRISLGRIDGVARSGYLVFRGSRKEALRLLRQACWALEKVELAAPRD